MAVDDAAGIRHLENHGLAVLVHHLLDGELVEVLGLVVGNLLAVYTEGLGKVAETIEETDGGHVDAAVGSLLDVVTGEDAETARVNLETVAEAVLHREVGYRGDIGAHGHGHVLLELVINRIDTCEQVGVAQDFVDTLGAEALEQHDGVFAGGTPQVGVELTEDGLAGAVPHPPQVLGKDFQGLEAFGEFGAYGNVAPDGRICVGYR